MAESTIGEGRFISNGKTLTISSLAQPELTISLDQGGVEELINFMTSHAGTQFNQREAFRVELGDSSGLSVSIRKDGTQVAASPRNLSLTGISVELRPDDWLDLQLDAEVEITLQFEGQIRTYRAIVRRREKNGYGLFFPESMKGEEVDPPPELAHLVMELQRRQVDQRLKRRR